MFLTRSCAGCGGVVGAGGGEVFGFGSGPSHSHSHSPSPSPSPGPGFCRRWPGGGRRLFCAACTAVVQPVGPIRGIPGFAGAGALYHYEGPIRRAIVAAKTGRRADVFRAAAIQLATLTESLVEHHGPPELVTWVPASRRGRSERGFDQGRIMAGIVGRQLGIPVWRVLAGGRNSQIGRGRAERLAADGYRARGAVQGPVLLIDDVITTGASMVSAADALRVAGASTVYGAAIAWAASAEELAVGRPLPIPAKSGPFTPPPRRAPGYSSG